MAAYNVLQSIPEVAAIDEKQLQAYCDEWVKRPIAEKLGIAYLIVDDEKYLQLVLDAERIAKFGERTYLPFDELVGFIIDQHFPDPDTRHRLHAELREVRGEWPESNYGVDAGIGRVGTLCVVCKNPVCGAWMKTAHKAVDGQTINCPPMELTCPACSESGVYAGRDCRVHVESCARMTGRCSILAGKLSQPLTD